MILSRVSAFARAARGLALAAVGLALGAGTLLGQGSTGKIEGRVRDQAGAPIANAQVFVVGTAFNALTNPQGYYFINNVPAGTISVRSAFIGYKSTQVDGVKVLAGQTGTVDIQLEQTAVEIQEITVVSQTQPLVPRDEVTTKQRVDGQFADALPVDRPEPGAPAPARCHRGHRRRTLHPRRPRERERHLHRRRSGPGRLPRRRLRRVGWAPRSRSAPTRSRKPRSPPDQLGRVRQREVGHHLHRHQDRRQRVPGLPGLRDRRAVRRQPRRRLQPHRGRASAARWRAGSPSRSTARSKAERSVEEGLRQPGHPDLPAGRRGHDDQPGQRPEDDPDTPFDERLTADTTAVPIYNYAVSRGSATSSLTPAPTARRPRRRTIQAIAQQLRLRLQRRPDAGNGPIDRTRRPAS